MTDLIFLPVPRNVTLLPGVFTLASEKSILIDPHQSHELLFAATRFQSVLLKNASFHWEITTSSAIPGDQIGLTLSIDPGRVPYFQGYEFLVNPGSIHITGGDAAGVFYGVCTLIQLFEQTSSRPVSHLPCLKVTDYPDFSARGVMIDISRDKVPTLETICELVDRLSSWKINQLQLYTEHTFAYRNHPEPWAKASPFTGEDILRLDDYCRQRYVELVPNQNSFGHMHRWLVHPQYRALAESPDGCDFPWGGHSDEPFSLCPVDPGSIQLIREMYDELLPHFSSRMVNVGCDETWDLGQGRSQAECAAKGTGRVYLEFLTKIYHEVRARGHRMQFWGDIILQHPELVSEIPKDVIALEWGYEATHPFEERCEKFATAGLDFYVCPGTSSWNTIAGRTDNALGNLLSAAESGLKHGAIGYLNTDWGDSGHWQPLPVSYLGYAAGAAYSWSLNTNRGLSISQAVSMYAFDDPTGNMGRVAYDLGNVYRTVGFEPDNASALFGMLQMPMQQLKNYQEKVTKDTLYKTLEAIDSALAPMNNARSTSPDADLFYREYRFAGRALRHACYRMLLVLGYGGKSAQELAADMDEIVNEHEAVWLARNRPGGLEDSVSRFNRAKVDYQKM
jgi:hexosaminidase